MFVFGLEIQQKKIFMKNLKTDEGVAIMLKGIGSTEPSLMNSMYSVERENFHSISEWDYWKLNGKKYNFNLSWIPLFLSLESMSRPTLKKKFLGHF